MNARVSACDDEYRFNKFCREQEIERNEAEFDKNHVTITKIEYNRLLTIEQELKESKMTPLEIAYSKLKKPCSNKYRMERVAIECKECGLECYGCGHSDCFKCRDKECQHYYED